DELSPWRDMMGSVYELNHIDNSPELQKKYRFLRYHDLVAVWGGKVVGFTSFATMPLGTGESVVYNLYTGVADSKFMSDTYGRNQDFRSRGIGRSFYVIRHGMAEEDCRKLGYAREVSGTVFESEFIGQAKNEEEIRYTRSRLDIHQRHGALTLMIDTGSGCWITPHLQPKLSEDSDTLLLHLLYRKLRIDQRLDKITEIDKDLARALLKAYIYNFEHQSTESELQEMRGNMESRFAAAKRFILVPPDQLPDMGKLASMDPMLAEQVRRDYGSIEEHEKKIKKALS
ncbi:MAG: GNAT family N-acetyltransferase, partial [Nitrososphaera sp.]|nr:GNAT family N-acetyltransferase [Nitrososphaera sp.]